MAGRPPKLTKRFLEEIKDRLIADLRLGMPHQRIADDLGIDRTTFYLWLDRGSKEKKGIYREFFDIVKKGEAECMKFHLANITNATKDKSIQWTPSAWFLERRFPEEFGRRDHFTFEGEMKTYVWDLSDPEAGDQDSSDS